MWNVELTRKASKQVQKLPVAIREKLAALLGQIEVSGPVRGDWANYSKLGGGEHHCHLTYRYVACWKETKKGITVEVYYVGSREKAPY